MLMAFIGRPLLAGGDLPGRLCSGPDVLGTSGCKCLHGGSSWILCLNVLIFSSRLQVLLKSGRTS